MQGFAFNANSVSLAGVGVAGGDAGVYRWEVSGTVDGTRVVRAGDLCIAPVIGGSAATWSASDVKFWAVGSGCCPEGGAPTCVAWDGVVNEGINWGWTARPKPIFLKSAGWGNNAQVGSLLTSGQGVKLVEVSKDGASGRITSLFMTPGWLVIVLPLVCWPILITVTAPLARTPQHHEGFALLARHGSPVSS